MTTAARRGLALSGLRQGATWHVLRHVPQSTRPCPMELHVILTFPQSHPSQILSGTLIKPLLLEEVSADGPDGFWMDLYEVGVLVVWTHLHPAAVRRALRSGFAAAAVGVTGPGIRARTCLQRRHL